MLLLGDNANIVASWEIKSAFCIPGIYIIMSNTKQLIASKHCHVSTVDHSTSVYKGVSLWNIIYA